MQRFTIVPVARATAATTAVAAAECSFLLAVADGVRGATNALVAASVALRSLALAAGAGSDGDDDEAVADLRLAGTSALLTASGAALLAGVAAATAEQSRAAFTLAFYLRKEGKALLMTADSVGEWGRQTGGVGPPRACTAARPIPLTPPPPP
jgi:hypothetical protein